MKFNSHPGLAGKHAVLSASKSSWVNYDDEKMEEFLLNLTAAQRGTELHAFAHEAIRLGIKLPKTAKTLNLYVNDAIAYRMTPEQTLYYSDNAFGTADAVGFRRNLLRIHDLKTGVNATSERQLYVYAAFFCLEYGYRPYEIETELRIYQSDEVRIYDGDADIIAHIMDKIITFDKRIEERKQEALG